VSEAAKKHKNAAGILVHNAALVPMCRELGYTFVALGSDGGAVRNGLISFAQAIKK
jgi:2-keto-3-deoxy-L-rhamnonate aldolase RhmA